LHNAVAPVREQFRQLLGQFTQVVPLLIVPAGQLAIQLPNTRIKLEAHDEH
jgi:hypothetical protein